MFEGSRVVSEVTKGDHAVIREITLCKHGANKNARIISVGGKSASIGALGVRSGAWDDPAAFRRPTWADMPPGATSAHMAQAEARFFERRLAAQYYAG
jgi:hypothetical protein